MVAIRKGRSSRAKKPNKPRTIKDKHDIYATVVRRHVEQFVVLRSPLLDLPLRDTAIDTGFGVRSGYRVAMVNCLAAITGFSVEAANDAFDAMDVFRIHPASDAPKGIWNEVSLSMNAPPSDRGGVTYTNENALMSPSALTGPEGRVRNDPDFDGF